MDFNGKTGALVGKERICEHIGVGPRMFYELVRLGLPVKKIGRAWLAHRNNIERFIEDYTGNNPTSDNPKETPPPAATGIRRGKV